MKNLFRCLRTYILFRPSSYVTVLLHFCCRLPWCVLRLHSVCNCRAWSDMGALSFLRPLHMREARGWRTWSPLGTCGGLWTPTKTKSQVQTLWQDKQDRHIPWLLSYLRMWWWSDPRISWDSDSGSSIRREEGCQCLISSIQQYSLLHTFKNLQSFMLKL